MQRILHTLTRGGASFDHLVGGYKERIWHREVECLGGFEVDDKSVHRWLLKWRCSCNPIAYHLAVRLQPEFLGEVVAC